MTSSAFISLSDIIHEIAARSPTTPASSAEIELDSSGVLVMHWSAAGEYVGGHLYNQIGHHVGDFIGQAEGKGRVSILAIQPAGSDHVVGGERSISSLSAQKNIEAVARYYGLAL